MVNVNIKFNSLIGQLLVLLLQLKSLPLLLLVACLQQEPL